MTKCNLFLEYNGKPYPRTCSKCGFGRCSENLEPEQMFAKLKSIATENQNSNLHSKIMNLNPVFPDGAKPELLYSIGFRDARHAAAELALKQNCNS